MATAPPSSWQLPTGAQLRVDRPDLSTDPTLDSCCQREIESERWNDAMRTTLQRHDVVAARARMRRHVVTTATFDGCRCCTDPNQDGGEYRALIELREELATAAEVTYDDGDNDDKRYDSEGDDEEDDEFDYLLDEDVGDESLKALEDARRAELEWNVLSREIAQHHGYGVHRQVHPQRILRVAGCVRGARQPPAAVVLHLVDPESVSSASLDLCLEELAAVKLGTMFLRSGGRSVLLLDTDACSKVLPGLRSDVDIPALVAIKDGEVVQVRPNLKGLVDDRSGHVVKAAVEQFLEHTGVLLDRAPPSTNLCYIRPEEEALLDNMQPPPEEELFDCGVAGCQKSFRHEHVGIRTTEQQGLVVSADDILDEKAE